MKKERQHKHNTKDNYQITREEEKMKGRKKHKKQSQNKSRCISLKKWKHTHEKQCFIYNVFRTSRTNSPHRWPGSHLENSGS